MTQPGGPPPEPDRPGPRRPPTRVPDLDERPGRRWPPTSEQVASARSGDSAALGEILTAAYPRLVSFYRGVGTAWSDAEDLASEACEGVVRNLPRLREPDAFEAWFWTIARNRFKTRLRRRGRTERELEYVAGVEPEEAVVAADEHVHIRRALAEIPPRDRELLWLCEVEGLSYSEVGGRLGLASGATRVAALRARRRLEAAYRRIHGEGT